MTANEINASIKESGVDTNLISDGYHTFRELYEHRITLFIALCKIVDSGYRDVNAPLVWRQTVKDGWFLMGISAKKGSQITYHLPESKWDETKFAHILKEDEYTFDGHNSQDVLNRIKAL